MTATEDRARAAMRAIAGTVNDAPPLRLAAAGTQTSPDEAQAHAAPPGLRPPP